MALGYVEHQRDDADYVSFGIELRGEGARFPNVLSLRGMFGDQQVGNFHDFPRQCAAHDIFHAAGAQAREDLGRDFSQYFLGSLAG